MGKGATINRGGQHLGASKRFQVIQMLLVLALGVGIGFVMDLALQEHRQSLLGVSLGVIVLCGLLGSLTIPKTGTMVTLCLLCSGVAVVTGCNMVLGKYSRLAVDAAIATMGIVVVSMVVYYCLHGQISQATQSKMYAVFYVAINLVFVLSVQTAIQPSVLQTITHGTMPNSVLSVVFALWCGLLIFCTMTLWLERAYHNTLPY
ncbi:MAG: hypothetical protein FWD76_05930 [Firmicutes bacterium]|nr:hypothetical protein [Bacillota bacterium]